MNDFDTALASFVEGCQILTDRHFAGHYPNVTPTKLSIDPRGRKYVRIVAKDGSGSRSVHCFVNRQNGDVLKAASWKAPAKHARGNIFDASNGLANMGPSGPAYLR